jgi:ABC-2 type transport system ATP-binding protein
LRYPNSLKEYNLELGEDKMSVNYTYNVQAKQTGITNLLQDLKDAGLKLKDLKQSRAHLRKFL